MCNVLTLNKYNWQSVVNSSTLREFTCCGGNKPGLVHFFSSSCPSCSLVLWKPRDETAVFGVWELVITFVFRVEKRFQFSIPSYCFVTYVFIFWSYVLSNKFLLNYICF